MRRQTKIVVLFFSFVYLSCGPGYEKEYYELISGIKIPAGAAQIETFDNGEYLTVTSFKISISDMETFYKRYAFRPVVNNFIPGFHGDAYLNGPRIENADPKKCLIKTSELGRASSIYILDTSRHLLWAVINYPDWSGD